MKQEEEKKWRDSGKLAAKVKSYARTLIKPETPALEIAEKVEKKIESFKAKNAFPISIACNEIAAHSSPAYNDDLKINGVVKVDLGISIDGFISDTAFTVDLTPENKYKELIKSSDEALKKAIKIIKPGIELWQIGDVIQKTISGMGFAPIRNLMGHSLERYKIHAGISIPNYNNNNKLTLQEGQIIAVEPFSTTGEGIVQDGKISDVYDLVEKKPVRDAASRKMIDFIEKEYSTLPFAGRWLVKEFGKKALFSLRMLEQAEALHHFPQLVEKTKHPVSHSEHTLLITKNGCDVLTEETE